MLKREYKPNFQENIYKSLNILIKEKSNIEGNKGWALIEKFDQKLIENNLITKIANNIFQLDNYIAYLNYLYTKKSLSDLLYKKYYSLFLPSCTSGLIYDISLVKRFIFIYTLLFIKILNDELRSGESAKIVPHLEIIAYIEREIKNKELFSYKGNANNFN